VQEIGRLPFPVTHAAGVELGGYMLVIGGRSSPSGRRHRSVLAVAPSGSVKVAGVLPGALSDMTAASTGAGAAHVLLAGGANEAGAQQAAILGLSVSR
jgi:N-acetylneuraminic acid mutarotase